MRAGSKNKRIRIEIATAEKSSFGSDVLTWALQREVWAQVQYLAGSENVPSGVVSEATVSFKLDYISGLSPITNRVPFNGLIYDIEAVQEVGFREATLLQCRARAITGIGEGIEGSVQQTQPQTLAQLIRQGTFNDAAPENTTDPIVLVSYAEYPATIVGINNLRTSAGTITLTIYINGIAVTGLSSIVVSSTPQSLLATAGNLIGVGDRVTLMLSDAAAPEDLEFTMKFTV